MNGSLFTCTRGGVSKPLNRPRRCTSNWERFSHNKSFLTPKSIAADMAYFQKQMFKALKIPDKYLGFPAMRMP